MYPWLHQYFEQYAQHYSAARLHHAHLITGATGVGKRALAQTVCESLLCQNPQQGHACGECKSCRLLAAGSHPDIKILGEEQGSVGVDAVREISEFTQQHAHLGGNQCVIIDYAHKMTDAACNALLKTLEEPNNQSYIWLVANDSHALPATILSRCNKQHVQVTHTNGFEQWLAEHCPEADKYPFARMFLAQPLLLKQWHDEQALGAVDEIYQGVAQIKQGTSLDRLVDILAQNSQYIAIFKLFISKYLLAQARKGLSFDAQYACHNALNEFARAVSESSGLNVKLALMCLVRTLQAQLNK